ncbi:MAG: pyridoxamine 5'-phosphate oxidase family protein [Lachnospiraceae bacterium]|nr:pyridoxamine 5'-phosphate oxidase family protein [Lachnospiraceae bacterium]
MSKISDFLNETGVFFLATVDGDQPKLRPLGLHIELDGKVMFGIGDFKDVYRQLIANPKCEIVAAKQDGHWMRYTGTAVFETDEKYAQVALEGAPHLKNIYNDETGHKMMMFHLEDATAVEIAVMGEGTDLMK